MAFVKHVSARRDRLTSSFGAQARRSMQGPGRLGAQPGHFSRQEYRPPAQAADVVRLVPGLYTAPRIDPKTRDCLRDGSGKILTEVLPYFEYVAHFHEPSRRSSICSAGPLGAFKGKGEPCHACDLYFHEWRARTRSRSDSPATMSRRTKWAIGVLVLAPFHRVEDVDKSGRRRLDAAGDGYFRWEKCAGHGCKLCARSLPTKQGHLFPWSLGRGDLSTLVATDAELRLHCKTCGELRAIEEIAWVCQNPRCGEAVIDLRSTSLSPQEIQRLTSRPVICPACDELGLLADVYECRVCTARGTEGERLTVFDVDLALLRAESAGAAAKSTLSITPELPPRPLDRIYQPALRRGLDLKELYRPTPFEMQKRRFGPLSSPAGAEQSRAASQPAGDPSCKSTR